MSGNRQTRQHAVTFVFVRKSDLTSFVTTYDYMSRTVMDAATGEALRFFSLEEIEARKIKLVTVIGHESYVKLLTDKEF